MKLGEEGWQDLSDAIVLCAVEDWRRSKFQLSLPSLKSKRAYDTSKECERFFKSSWFDMLTGLDGQTFLRRLKEGFCFD